MKNQSIYLNKIQKAANKFAMILIASAAMVLVGCGGGGGGGGTTSMSPLIPDPSPPPPPTTVPTPTADIAETLEQFLGSGDMAARITMVHTQLTTAAKTDPKFGSTTQSSEAEDRVGIADADAVSLRDGQISLTIENSGSGATWDSISMTDDNVVMNTMNSNGNHVVQLTQVLTGGTVYLNTVIDIDNPTIRFEDVDVIPQRLTVGDIYTPVGFFVTIGGVLGELVCIDEDDCGFAQEFDSLTFVNATNYVFTPEGTMTQITLTVGQVADSFFSEELRFDEVLGTIDIIKSSDCDITDDSNGCRILTDPVDGSSDVRITGFVGDHDFVPHGGQTLIVIEDDTDYLIGGTWLYILADREALEVGAFADGSEELTDLPTSGTATYSGNAYGIRLMANTPSNFSASVRLEADFDTSTIDGMITGANLPSALTLGGADGNIIRDESALNFGSFAGDTGMDGGYTGKWGGNFYGDGASSAAGTFGVSRGNAGEADADSFIGHFGATVESTE